MLNVNRFVLGGIIGLAILIAVIAYTNKGISSKLEQIARTLDAEAERSQRAREWDALAERVQAIEAVVDEAASQAATEPASVVESVDFQALERRLEAIEGSINTVNTHSTELASAVSRDRETIATLSAKIDALHGPDELVEQPAPAETSPDTKPSDAFLGTWIAVGNFGGDPAADSRNTPSKLSVVEQDDSIEISLWESDPDAESPDSKLTAPLGTVVPPAFAVSKETVTTKQQYSFRMLGELLFVRIYAADADPEQVPETLLVNPQTEVVTAEMLLGLPLATVQKMLAVWGKKLGEKPQPVLKGSFPDGIGTIYVSYQSAHPVDSVVGLLVDGEPLAKFAELPPDDQQIDLQVEGVPVLFHRSYTGRYFEELYSKPPYDCNVSVELVRSGGGPETTAAVLVDGKKLEPGDPFLRGADVTLHVVGVEMPDLTRIRRSDLKAYLRQFGLTYLEIGVIPEGSFMNVRSQFPAAGTLIRRGRQVTVSY